MNNLQQVFFYDYFQAGALNKHIFHFASVARAVATLRQPNRLSAFLLHRQMYGTLAFFRVVQAHEYI